MNTGQKRTIESLITRLWANYPATTITIRKYRAVVNKLTITSAPKGCLEAVWTAKLITTAYNKLKEVIVYCDGPTSVGRVLNYLVSLKVIRLCLKQVNKKNKS